PHQHLLILPDITDKTRYHSIPHLTMQFFTKPLLPITSLSFPYHNPHLHPIFIFRKNNKQKTHPNLIQRLQANTKKFKK
ncbi:DUF1444 family protein, partial [Staphylococcus epidermidis]|uniref:DUF1444 family protein n=1 Tax=Staphylococcus epidermidis TaxID=1282 RepID=UPI00119FC4F6